MITVHHLNQSRSLRILWLLEELDLPYQVIRYERDAKTNLAPPELAAVHPLGKSPVIEIDGQVVAESGAIIETLVARHSTPDGTHLAPPAGTDAYIQHLELMHFAEGSIMTPLLLNLYTARLGEAAAPLQPRIQQEMANHYGYLEQIIRPSGHFVLDDLSAADIMLSFPVGVLSRIGLDSSYPNLAAFNQMVQARPAYQKALEQAGGD